MTHDELQAIKQRIDMAKNCHGETFDADINGEDPRQYVDIIRDQDRSALYLEVLALSAKLIEVEQQRDVLRESREADLAMIQELDAAQAALSVKLEEAEKRPVAHRYFDHRGIENELDEALMLAFGATETHPGDTDPDTWPCGHMVYDDYDGSFELWGVKDDAWVPTSEQLAAAFALGFARCWICYEDGTERYYSPGDMAGDRKPSQA